MVEQPVYLPAQPTPLIGRDREVAAVTARLHEPGVRLLTLSGPGGVGKTRLALAVATVVAETFDLGATFVDLASTRDPTLVATTIVQTVGVREVGHRPAQLALADYLRDRSILVIVDNFEHILSAAPQLAEMLVACPSLTILVTSRAALHLRWEHEISVAPLAVTSAIELFIERARAVGPAFVPTRENREAIAAICAKLDGLPLAIELAAAHTRVLSPTAILARLERRLRLLTGGPRDLPVHQRTLRDAIAWSYDLLTEDERRLFRQLAVFVGGWTLEAAEAVCAGEGIEPVEVLDLLTSLVEQSLVVVEVREGEPRYRLLETIREYAQEQLAASGAEDAAQRGHATYFLNLVEQAELDGPTFSVWLDRLNRELANLRAALTWCSATGDAGELELRLVGALGQFWHLSGHIHEGRSWIDDALRRADLSGDAPARATALYGAGLLTRDESDYATARRSLELSRLLWSDLDEPRWLARTSMVLGTVVRHEGDPDVARMLFHQSIEQFRAAEDEWGIARALSYLGDLELSLSRYDEARAHHQEGLTIAQRMGDRGYIGYNFRNIGYVALATGGYTGARRAFAESLKLNHEVNDLRAVAASLAALGRLFLAEGRIEPAVRLLGATEGLLEARGIESLFPDEQRELIEALHTARRSLPTDTFAAVYAAGRALALDEALALALATSVGAVNNPGATPLTLLTTTHDETGLSTREREVLRLLATGKSNPEIADELVISRNTVYRHVNHIFTKLGVQNRTEAATLAQRQGLV